MYRIVNTTILPLMLLMGIRSTKDRKVGIRKCKHRKVKVTVCILSFDVSGEKYLSVDDFKGHCLFIN